MTRKTLRWAIFSALLAIVVGIAATNSVANARFSAKLRAADPEALSEFAERPDAYNVFIAFDRPTRLKIIHELGRSRLPGAPTAIALLSRDPDISVRNALVEALAKQTSQGASLDQIAATTDPAQRALLTEALLAAGPTGLRTAQEFFLRPEFRVNAASALARFGGKAAPFLIEQLRGEDTDLAMDAAETLVRLGAIPQESELTAALWSLLLRVSDLSSKDRLLPILARFPVPEASPLFLETLSDQAAPPRLRLAAAIGLRRLGLTDELERFGDDPDPDVRAAAAHHRHGVN